MYRLLSTVSLQPEPIDLDVKVVLIDQRAFRLGRLKDRYHEEILRNSIFIDTEGSKTGQVNGLFMVTLERSSSGHPVRITARVRVGKGELVNIERGVEMISLWIRLEVA